MLFVQLFLLVFTTKWFGFTILNKKIYLSSENQTFDLSHFNSFYDIYSLSFAPFFSFYSTPKKIWNQFEQVVEKMSHSFRRNLDLYQYSKTV